MAETLSYHSIRSANQAREADEQRTESRKKNLLILMLQYLSHEGYVESADSLGRETNIDLNKYEVADNVDLETVLMEYESYYYIKFNRYPKIAKKLTNVEEKPPKFTSAKNNSKLRRLGPWSPRVKHRGLTVDFLPQVKANSLRDTRPSNGVSLPRIPAQKPQSPSSCSASSRPRSAARRSERRESKHSAAKKQSPQKSVVKKQSPQKSNPSNGPLSPSTSDNGIESFSLQGLVVHGSQSNTDQRRDQEQVSGKPKVGQIIDIRSMINDATRLNSEDGMDAPDRLLKPLGGYMGYNNEWRELAQIISREIYSHNPNVKWDDIIGLDSAKRLVKEAVVYPIKYPQLFTGILSPWKGLLLYGPPGTGKTLLAKAVATECKTTFFNISASSIVSKWRGDSEKLVRVLFELARFHAPATIFIDELESLMSQRGSSNGQSEHEGSRRMKTELLVQMDGLAKTEDLVFLLAASNLPWELDHAMLRRLEKRILVDLPTVEARQAMFMHHLPHIVNHSQQAQLELISDIDYNICARKTEGYSGSDIRLVAKEAAMRPVRKIFEILENHIAGEEIPHIKLDTITTDDVEIALRHTKPSAGGLKAKYAAWQKEYESV